METAATSALHRQDSARTTQQGAAYRISITDLLVGYNEKYWAVWHALWLADDADHLGLLVSKAPSQPAALQQQAQQ